METPPVRTVLDVPTQTTTTVDPPVTTTTDTTTPPSESTPNPPDASDVGGKDSASLPQVLGTQALAAVGASPTLPFTGINLGAVAFLGVALVALGVALRRRSRRSQ